MKLTTAQVFLIGNLIIGGFVAGGPGAAMLGVYHLTADAITQITVTCGFVLWAWNGIAVVLTKPSDQLAAVVARKDEPSVQTAIVTTASNYPGVQPIDINRDASPALAQLAVNTTIPKVQVQPGELESITRIASDGH